ncbi:MAG: hypothetical protein CME25_10105 [Gemmatimonadetes bacterium]|nr:hypothetical protein [Gemmatimonadota bacterium]
MKHLTKRRKAVLPARETPLSRRYLRVLQQWVALGVEYFQDWDVRPNCGHFFGGCSWYGHETIGPAMTFAAVASSPEFDAEICGCSRRSLQDMALKAIRYACFVHDTGPEDCVRPAKGFGRKENCGNKWGERGKGFFPESQCGRYVAKMTTAALLLGRKVDDETWQMIENIHLDYADRFADMAPKSGIYTNTQMEENAWTSVGLASVECILSNHPDAEKFSEAARRWMFLTVTSPQDHKNHAITQGDRTVARQVGETYTVLPDYWTENHGMIHPTYTASCLEFLNTIGVIYGTHGKDVPEQARFNRQRIYDHLKIVADRNGYLHPVQGMDWPYLFPDPGTQMHSAASIILRDPDGARIERRALENLEKRISGCGGRLIDPETSRTCNSIQDPLLMVESTIVRPGLTYLLHRLLGDGPRPTPDTLMELKFRGASAYPHAGFAYNLHRKGQTSFSWRNSVMALPLNKDGIYTVAPASNTFLGKLSVRNRPDSQEQVSVDVDQQEHGFAAALVMNRAQASVRQEVLFASLPSGIALSMERFVAEEPVTVSALEQGFLRIVNENFPEISGNCNGYRILHTPEGSSRFDGEVSSDPDSDIIQVLGAPEWINVDGRLGIVYTGTGKTIYHNRHYFQPWWAIADDLILSRQVMPKRFRAGEQIGKLTALIAPDSTPGKTSLLLLYSLESRSNAAGLIADGHLAAANFGQRPRSINLTGSKGAMSEFPIFEGTTKITNSRIIYRRRLEAGQALLQKSLALLSTSDPLDIVADYGNICLRNPGKNSASANITGRGKIKIPAGKTIWLE